MFNSFQIILLNTTVLFLNTRLHKLILLNGWNIHKLKGVNLQLFLDFLSLQGLNIKK